MRHPPPDDEKKKLAEVPQTPGQLTVDGQTNILPVESRLSHGGPDSSFFILAQQADSDKVSLPFLVGWSVNAPGDYIPTDSHGQIPVRIVQTPTKAKMATLAGLMIRERQAKDEADRAGDGDAWLKAMDRLWLLHAEYSNVRGIIEYGP